MKRRYLLISVEIWQVDKSEIHEIETHRETEIPIPRSFKIQDVTDAGQRAVANMIEILKDYLDNPRNPSDNG